MLINDEVLGHFQTWQLTTLKSYKNITPNTEFQKCVRNIEQGLSSINYICSKGRGSHEKHTPYIKNNHFPIRKAFIDSHIAKSKSGYGAQAMNQDASHYLPRCHPFSTPAPKGGERGGVQANAYVPYQQCNFSLQNE